MKGLEKYPEFQAAWKRFNELEVEIINKKAELDDFAFDDWLYADDPGVFNFFSHVSPISRKGPKPEDYRPRVLKAVRVYDHPKFGRQYRVFCSRSSHAGKDTDIQILFSTRKFKTHSLLGVRYIYHTCPRCQGTGVPNWDVPESGKCDCLKVCGLHIYKKDKHHPYPLGERVDEILFGLDKLEAVDW